MIITTYAHHGKHDKYTIIVLPHVRGSLKWKKKTYKVIKHYYKSNKIHKNESKLNDKVEYAHFRYYITMS